MESSRPEAIRWGVLGTALIARQHVIPALQSAAGCDLVAVASRSADTASSAAEEFEIRKSHGSYEALLADPEIDAVYVPLPNDLHARWTIRALSAGKHVLCEKPITLRTAEAEKVAAAAAQHDVLVMEAFMYRFHPAWDIVRRLLTDDTIGRITDVSIWFGFRSTRPDDYRHTLATGGGALYDVGCYCVDVCRTLLGPVPENVLATARVGPESGVDMTFTAILDYGAGTATFTCSMEQEPQHSIVIHGTEGWISIADPFNCPRHHATTVTIGRGGNHHPHATTIETLRVPVADQYGLQATAFADAILAETAAPLPIEDSIDNMRLLERLFVAAGLTLPEPS